MRSVTQQYFPTNKPLVKKGEHVKITAREAPGRDENVQREISELSELLPVGQKKTRMLPLLLLQQELQMSRRRMDELFKLRLKNYTFIS